MIDLNSETLIPLRDAPKHRLFRRKSWTGRPVTFSTVWRWATQGVRGGIRLETVRVGGSLCTSKAAIISFIEALSKSEPSAAVLASDGNGIDGAASHGA